MKLHNKDPTCLGRVFGILKIIRDHLRILSGESLCYFTLLYVP